MYLELASYVYSHFFSPPEVVFVRSSVCVNLEFCALHNCIVGVTFGFSVKPGVVEQHEPQEQRDIPGAEGRPDLICRSLFDASCSSSMLDSVYTVNPTFLP